MKAQIVIKVSPTGETEVRTEGFVGNGCRQASQFIERALGSRQSEQLTADYFKSNVVAATNQQLQQGESP